MASNTKVITGALGEQGDLEDLELREVQTSLGGPWQGFCWWISNISTARRGKNDIPAKSFHQKSRKYSPHVLLSPKKALKLAVPHEGEGRERDCDLLTIAEETEAVHMQKDTHLVHFILRSSKEVGWGFVMF